MLSSATSRLAEDWNDVIVGCRQRQLVQVVATIESTSAGVEIDRRTQIPMSLVDQNFIQPVWPAGMRAFQPPITRVADCWPRARVRGGSPAKGRAECVLCIVINDGKECAEAGRTGQQVASDAVDDELGVIAVES